MYSQFQASYQRVEASLQKLTDSIAAYNPSTTAADELAVADDAVQQNVETCMAAFHTDTDHTLINDISQ